LETISKKNFGLQILYQPLRATRRAHFLSASLRQQAFLAPVNPGSGRDFSGIASSQCKIFIQIQILEKTSRPSPAKQFIQILFNFYSNTVQIKIKIYSCFILMSR
jgi:hypothetical protein